jgi:hypothetical protein
MSHSIILPVGARGVFINVPPNVRLLGVDGVASNDRPPLISVQQELIKAALQSPDGASSLAEVAKGHRRVLLIVGDLGLPAPYETALPPVIEILTAAEIRPTRIALATLPGNYGPVLGRGAIRRYGEAIVAEHEIYAWTQSREVHPAYDAADLRILIAPAIGLQHPLDRLPQDPAVDLVLELELGNKATLDIVGATAYAPAKVPAWKKINPLQSGAVPDVFITGGVGPEWEATLEEALLSLHLLAESGQAAKGTVVLGFTGDEGLGSAHFCEQSFIALEEAEGALARGEQPVQVPPGNSFDPTQTMLRCLLSYKQVILYSRPFLEQEDGQDFQAQLDEWPNLAKRLFLCADETSLWMLLAQFHGSDYSLRMSPLGWRSVAQSKQAQ